MFGFVAELAFERVSSFEAFCVSMAMLAFQVEEAAGAGDADAMLLAAATLSQVQGNLAHKENLPLETYSSMPIGPYGGPWRVGFSIWARHPWR